MWEGQDFKHRVGLYQRSPTGLTDVEATRIACVSEYHLRGTRNTPPVSPVWVLVDPRRFEGFQVVSVGELSGGLRGVVGDSPIPGGLFGGSVTVTRVGSVVLVRSWSVGPADC